MVVVPSPESRVSEPTEDCSNIPLLEDPFTILDFTSTKPFVELGSRIMFEHPVLRPQSVLRVISPSDSKSMVCDVAAAFIEMLPVCAVTPTFVDPVSCIAPLPARTVVDEELVSVMAPPFDWIATVVPPVSASAVFASTRTSMEVDCSVAPTPPVSVRRRAAAAVSVPELPAAESVIAPLFDRIATLVPPVRAREELDFTSTVLPDDCNVAAPLDCKVLVVLAESDSAPLDALTPTEVELVNVMPPDPALFSATVVAAVRVRDEAD
jgi:hypothetical protein